VKKRPSLLLPLLLSLTLLAGGCVERVPEQPIRTEPVPPVRAEPVRAEEPVQPVRTDPIGITRSEEFQRTRALLLEKGYITPETRVFGVGEVVRLERGTVRLDGMAWDIGGRRGSMTFYFIGKEDYKDIANELVSGGFPAGAAILLIDGKAPEINWISRGPLPESVGIPRSGRYINRRFRGMEDDGIRDLAFRRVFEMHFPQKNFEESVWKEFPDDYKEYVTLFKFLNKGLPTEFRAAFIITRKDISFFK